ncbi:MAG: hypothetical protein GY787_25410 [Alteromonadales bacterium]|nr:hypothetical protein [Alteromonadales bacterium]
MNLLTQNSKIKKTSKHFGVKLMNFGIPAYKSASGKLTCPMADECVKFCYAKKGAYIWSNVQPAFEKRYELSKTDKFIESMNDEIRRKKPDFVRVHDSGDYYSRAYLNKWIQIAKDNPDVKFYSYTNMIKLTKEVQLPDNYDIIYSDSGKQKHLINAEQDRHTRIFSSTSDLTDSGYVDSSEYDLRATKWYSPDNHKVGLVFH